MKKLNQWIDRFAYSHPRFGIPNLMLYIVIANAVTYILIAVRRVGGPELFEI